MEDFKQQYGYHFSVKKMVLAHFTDEENETSSEDSLWPQGNSRADLSPRMPCAALLGAPPLISKPWASSTRRVGGHSTA